MADNTKENDLYIFDEPYYFSRRSPVFGIHGAVACSQPLASEIGIRILQQGGNAADATVAVAAALNVTQPTSTGIGGDAFCLFYDAKQKKVFGLNGSGRCPQALTIDRLEKEFGIYGTLPIQSVHTVTVPGAAAAWVDTVEKFGTMTIKQVLQPAIQLAEEGFPVSPLTSNWWESGLSSLKNGPHANEMLLSGRPPRPGEIMKLPTLAQTFREVAEHGKKGFYEGKIAQAIVDLCASLGGTLSLQDLKDHITTFDEPISVNYHGIDVWEMPPNGQGITALLALNILEGFDLSKIETNSTEYLHLMIESLRLAFADTRYYVADPSKVHVPIKELLSKEYAAERRKLINLKKASVDIKKGSPVSFSNTVYFCVVDKEGNACSFINSNYMGFGTGLIPKGCGFTLQNRGANFSLDRDHPNALAPGKRPYHTIIPGLATKNGELYCPFAVMGGFNQPQAQIQVLNNMIIKKLDPQRALDTSRFLIFDGTQNGEIWFEEGISEETIKKLKEMGHNVKLAPVKGHERKHFGVGQIIRKMNNGVLWVGSDPRSDGCAIAY